MVDTSAASAHVDTFVRDRLPDTLEQPRFLFNLPELQFPETLNASSIIDLQAEGHSGKRPAVLSSNSRWNYTQYLEWINRTASFLSSINDFEPGNRVLLHGPNSPLMMALWWGILRAGGIAVTTMPLLRSSELETIINKAAISHALIDDTVSDSFRGAMQKTSHIKQFFLFNGDGGFESDLSSASNTFTPVATASDDPAIIAFTSGTTGQPKGCVHYHRDILAMAETFSRHVVKPDAGDVFCGTPPIAFTFGLGASVVFPAACGAATAVTEGVGVDAVIEAITAHKVTTLFTAPTAYRGMLNIEPTTFSSLHTCVSAGEHLPKSTSEAWKAHTGITLIDGIGATEMIHIFISASGDDVRPGSTGKVVPGYQACILGQDMKPVARGKPGRLAVRGPTGCRYLDDERQNNYVKSGWNLTGDIFYQDFDGYFWYISRADDMIISSGYNIAAPEVENALLSHSAVAEAAVIGVPDDDRGQICKAFIVLTAEGQEKEIDEVALQTHVKQEIAPYKYPREIKFVDRLPKTHTGKLQRYKLHADQE